MSSEKYKRIATTQESLMFDILVELEKLNANMENLSPVSPVKNETKVTVKRGEK